jgi:hypothetical protein
LAVASALAGVATPVAHSIGICVSLLYCVACSRSLRAREQGRSASAATQRLQRYIYGTMYTLLGTLVLAEVHGRH